MAIMKTRGVVLRERDLEVLAALEKWGVLGLAQMEGLVFRKQAPAEERIKLFHNEMDRRMYTLACYKRLRDLELAGYVRAHFYLNHPKLVGLTERGHRLLLERGKAKILGFRRYMAEALLTHEIRVNAVGLIIQELLGIRVRPELERRIRSVDALAGKPARSVVADLWIRDDEHPKPIEVELTQKSELRYKALWQRFIRTYPYGSQVLYLVGWPDGVECLLKLTRKFDQSGSYHIWVASLNDFRKSAGCCWFINNTYHERRYLRLAKPKTVAPVAAAAAQVASAL